MAHRNHIAGEWAAPASGRHFENRNPATGELIGEWPLSSREDVERAVESAWRGFREWSRTPAPKRGDVLRRVGDQREAGDDDLLGTTCGGVWRR